MPDKKRLEGFTLVELLVVIAIIALLMAILMPALNRARKQAQGARCMASMRQIGLAAFLYAEDNDGKVPRDETDGYWPIMFMPYVAESKRVGITDYSELGIYNCPSYPDKEQTVDYVINAFDLKTADPDTEQRGATKLDDFPRHGTTIYLADYEWHESWSHIKIVRKNDNTVTLRDKFKWLDIWHRNHLPSSDTGRRVARDRHGKGILNCLFVDGHSGKMDSLKITAYDFGRPSGE